MKKQKEMAYLIFQEFKLLRIILVEYLKGLPESYVHLDEDPIKKANDDIGLKLNKVMEL
jgi:hypothetical protein